MRWWKILGLAAFASVAASGIVIARDQRHRRAYTPAGDPGTAARPARRGIHHTAGSTRQLRAIAPPSGSYGHARSGMTVCPIAVILGTSFGPWEGLQGVSRSGCGVTVLGGEDGRDWSQRYKANLEKLASGDLVQVVAVVRDLAGREASRGLSAGEKRMLAKARLILLQEG